MRVADVVVTLLSFVLGILVPWAVVRWDTERLSEERLARAWNEASFWSAIVAFGPIAVWVHFAKTRASLAGFWLGLLAATLTTAMIGLVTSGAAWLLGGN